MGFIEAGKKNLDIPSAARPVRPDPPVHTHTLRVVTEPMVEELIRRVDEAQAQWTNAVISGDADALLDLYKFPVAFKPTLSGDVRTTKEGALSYFVNDNPSFPLDDGFLFNDWQDIRWERKAMHLPKTVTNEEETRIIDMGHYYFTAPDGEVTKVDYTFGYTLEKPDGRAVIDTHHSSLNYEKPAGIEQFVPYMIGAGALLLILMGRK